MRVNNARVTLILSQIYRRVIQKDVLRVSKMKRLVIATLVFSMVAGLGFIQRAADACPFCQATSQTFAESIEARDVAVYAKLVKPAPAIKPGTRLSEGHPLNTNFHFF